MVIFLYLLLPILAFAGDFTSHVNRNPTNLGEGFTLTLTLSNHTPKGHPALEPLRESFIIHSQSQSNSFQITNGKTASSTLWQLTLIPQKAGKLTIPAIIIATDSGILATDPITLEVSNEKAKEQDVSLETTASTRKPYKNETILYSVKLISPHNLNNISLENIALEDAIVELAEKPKIQQEVINGVKNHVVEYNYLITPLKPGTLIIPSLALQGEIPVRSKGGHRDLFAMMQGFDQIKPFVLNTDRIQLEVNPAEDNIQPWLPAESLVIKETFPTGPLQAHEPFTRSFEINGEGILATHLPDLSALQNDPSFRIYSDNPELKTQFQNGKILSSRKEFYTLIPQSDGSLTLPAISVEWWDTRNHKKNITTIPARTLQVLPSARTPAPEAPAATVITEPQNTTLLYTLIVALAILLTITMVALFVLQRQIINLKTPPKAKTTSSYAPTVQVPKVKKEKKDKLPDLNPT